MVVGAECDTAQFAVGIVDDVCVYLVNRDSLENSLHGLLTVHDDNGLGIGGDNGTCSILPLLEAIAEVFRGFQRHHSTFLILFQIRVAGNPAGLSGFHDSSQHIFCHLSSGTDECSLDDYVRETHLLGLAQPQKREVHLQGLVGSSRNAGNLLRE